MSTAVQQPQPPPSTQAQEGGFWNSISDMLFTPSIITDQRFNLDVPEDEVWIPSDQTLHWGKRPNYTYPTIKVEKEKKTDVPTIPRGTKLCARLWFCEWSWDEVDQSSLITPEQKDEHTQHVKSRLDSAQHSCLDDEKVMIPFEKGTASFRHLRISKTIKLKKAETFSIHSIGFEIGYHNPFNKTSFTSLEIFLSRPVRIHIVAHKGSVKLLQKHGLIPASAVPQPQSAGVAANSSALNIAAGIPETHTAVLANRIPDHLQSSTPLLPPAQTRDFPSFPGHPALNHFVNANSSSPLLSPNANALMPFRASSTQPHDSSLSMPVSTLDTFLDANDSSLKRRIDRANDGITEVMEAHKRLKAAQLVEIVNDLTVVQSGIDALKRKIGEFMQDQAPGIVAPKTFTKVITRADRTINPFLFTFYAFRTHNLELGLSLIKTYSFDVNAKNNAGWTVLHISARHGFVEGVKWCLAHGANVNSQNDNKNTPLHLAYLRSDKTIRKLLKEGNADRDAMNYKGLKPRDYRNNRKPLIRTIPSAACSVEIVIEGISKSFYLEIWSAARFGWLEVVKLYLEQFCCDIDIKTTNGQTPLMCAVEHRREEVARYLLQMGADVNARDVYDFTALHYAYTSSAPKIIDMLENQFHADVTLKDIFGRTASWYAASNNGF